MMPRARNLKTVALTLSLAPHETLTPDTIASTSKIAKVIAMLQRSDGATLTELTAMTGWLPHTTRAALTGLRKKGHTLNKHSRDGCTVYAIAKGA